MVMEAVFMRSPRPSSVADEVEEENMMCGLGSQVVLQLAGSADRSP
jgi:hypothetical protein